MKTKLTILLLVVINLLNAQTIQFISKTTGEPLQKVSVIGKDGDILAYSDIEGKIDKTLITKDQEEFQLIYENQSLAKLPYSNFENSVIKLNDLVKDIEPVIIKKGDQAKYIHVTGNFTTYVSLNKGLNSYADGIVTYIFDRESGKLKSTNVLQYRIYENVNATNEEKKVATYDYRTLLKIPNLKYAGNFKNYLNTSKLVKELKVNDKDVVEKFIEGSEEDVISFLGYRLMFLESKTMLSFNKNSTKNITDFINYSEIEKFNLKHKTEKNFTAIDTYQNFYVTEIDYNNEKKVADVSFKKDNSNYKNEYWNNTDFPNLQIIFSSYFKEDLKLK